MDIHAGARRGTAGHARSWGCMPNVKPECRHGCTFLRITDNMYLCPHTAFGQATYLRGAVEEARRLLERAGGYEAELARINKEKEQKKLDKLADAERTRAARYG